MMVLKIIILLQIFKIYDNFPYKDTSWVSLSTINSCQKRHRDRADNKNKKKHVRIVNIEESYTYKRKKN